MQKEPTEVSPITLKPLKASSEFSAMQITKAAKLLYPDKKHPISQMTWRSRIIPPRGKTYYRGRKCFTQSDAVMILLTHALKEDGVSIKIYQSAIPDILQALDTGLADTTYILGDSRQVRLYNALYETPVLSILDGSSQFFWSFALGINVRSIEAALDLVR